MSRALPLDALRAFEAAARLLSFTRAGEELHLTQSAISRQIQAIETALGVPLFVRKTRALELTPEGHILARAVRDGLRRIQHAADEIAGKPRRQVVVVSTWPSFASLWLVPRLAEFQRTAPEIDVRLSATDGYVDLSRERVDVAVRYSMRGAPSTEALKIFEETVFPVASPELLRQPGMAITQVADLANHTLLHLDDRLPWRQLAWDYWLEEAGSPGLEPRGSLTFNYTDQQLQAAARGHGVALGRSFLVADMMQRGELVAPLLPPRGPLLASGGACYLVTESEASGRPEVRRFVDWMQREVARSGAAAAART